MSALGAACLALALWLSWWAAGLFHEMDEFYRTAQPDLPDAVYRYYDTISHNSYVMQDALGPLISGAVFAVLAALAAAAVRWERAS